MYGEYDILNFSMHEYSKCTESEYRSLKILTHRHCVSLGYSLWVHSEYYISYTI